ncbi:steryl-sulfatase-like [Stegodyphus dumicola]|uniref:steryl-sulfatase-like n=1 Tax=Stegodyphus dumicola TaxID=202533 RepID=UPI0015AED1FF|nr:steryl-sulfatase-like [Stegodyphus dumicola]
MESSNRNKVFLFVAASGGLPEREITFAQALKTKGYSTAIIGKWHLGNDCHIRGDGCHHPLNHGFDYFYGLPLSNFKDFGDDGQSVVTTYVPDFYSYSLALIICAITVIYFIYSKHKFVSIFILILFVILPIILSLFILNLKTVNGILMENKEVIEQPITLKGLTQRFVKKAKDFLSVQTAEKKPFLLYMPFVHVHTALFCSDEFSGKSKYGRYGDNIAEMDWAVGEIVKSLQTLELINNTFIYFSSDNGGHIEEVGKNGQREGGHNGIFKGGKMMGGMEGGIRVPSIISWPGHIHKHDIDVATSQMDIFSTISDLANIPLPTDRIIDGKSLVPLLKDGSESPHKFLFHYCGKQIHAATYIDTNGQNVWKVHWITPKFIPGTDRCLYVCHCFGKFVVHHDPPLLFDLSTDPSESNPIDAITNDYYLKIISKVNEAKFQHFSSLEYPEDQFSFLNSVWKPWLQPCCNFPYCKCTDLNFTVQSR